MHRIILKKSVDFGTKMRRMAADVPYLIETKMLGGIAAAVDGEVQVEPWNGNLTKKLDADTILLIRSGGAGDLLFLTPAIRALKKRLPWVKIYVATLYEYRWILATNPYIESIIDFPMEESRCHEFDWIIPLEGAIENAKDKHAVDVIAEACGVELADKQTEYHPFYQPEYYDALFPRKAGKKRIAVQAISNSPVRTYPKMNHVFGMLDNMGYETVIYGEPCKLPTKGRNVIDLTTAGMSWQQNVDMLQTCDGMVGPDSSITHFAASLSIPTVAVYGSFPWQLRTAYQPSVRALSGNGECAGCQWHGNGGRVFPEGKPCNEAGKCVVLDSVDPERVVKELKKLIGD